MGLIFNGNNGTDTISATDGSLVIDGLDLGGVGNINAGIGTFSGNLNVGGVLTYEDVKNVDSVGIVTARSGIDCNGTLEVSSTSNFDDTVKIADKIEHLGDSNTNIRFPAADNISFETAGAQRLLIGDDGQTTITAASGDSILHLKRSDTNTTGLTGGINFAALDGHSVASIQARGDGDNEGAHLQFYTTSAAAGDMFHSASIERLRITSAGVIQCKGETDVQNSIFRVTDGTPRIIMSVPSGGLDTRLFNDGSGNFIIGHGTNSDAPTERLRIDSSGHLHTGYTTNVTGADQINILSADGGGVSVAQNNDGNATSGTTIGSYSFQGYHQGGATFASAEARVSAIAAANHTGSSAATDLAFYTKPSTTGPGSAPTERLRITSGGVLCVGATAADGDEFLRVKNKLLVMNTANTGDAFVKIKAGESGGSVLEFEADEGDDYADLWRIQNAGDGLLGFRTKASGSWVEKLRITSSGEVGISPAGVTPTAGDLTTGDSQNTPVLHVKGSGSSATGGDYNLLGRFESGGDADHTGAMVVLNHANDRGLAIIGGRASANTSFGAIKSIDNVGRLTDVMTFTGKNGQGVDNIILYTGDSTTTTERLLIDSSGNIGQAVTPSAWSSAQANDFFAYQVGSGVALFGRGSGDQDRGGISANLYCTATAWKYIANGNAGRIYFEDGSIVFNTCDSGTAGATATLNERFKITTDGSVMIGSGTPSEDLHLKKARANFLVEGTNDTVSGNVANINVRAPYYRKAGYSISDAGGNEDFWIGRPYGEGDTTAAVHINMGGVERLRIESAGNVKVSTYSAAGYVADFNQTHTSNSAQIRINSPTDSNSRPCLIDFARAGTVYWSAGMGYNDVYSGYHICQGGSLSSGTTNSKFVVTPDGYTGIGNYAGARTVPVTSLLHVATNWDNGGVPMVHFEGCNNEAPTNSSSANISFQISDENSNVLHKIWNTGGGNNDLGKVYYAGQMGIGPAAGNPSEQLYVSKNHNGHTRAVIQNNWGANATAQLKLVSPTDEFQLVKYASGDAHVTLSNSANIKVNSGGAERIEIQPDKGGLDINNCQYYQWGGSASCNSTWSVEITPRNTGGGGNIYQIKAYFSHHSLGYGAYLDGVYCAYSGHTGMQQSTAHHSHTSPNGGSWGVTRASSGTNPPVVITHTAGSYNGSGHWFVWVLSGTA